ncbi:hypothetical protein BT63DRAFT_286454 [Microthyrium microscopicum]|uniref:Polarized growth protein Boi2 n=1 Tax=Microthyrium microscopicum TaxID=703497 RepID=A0A6A6U999_9PEZI|nr:hypothetical protein BT63DRAFT_286454 [Microthyrium microscopicum]
MASSKNGDILIVIHEFIARSEDELTLRRGERIELIERDDEFGDGWYLGKQTKTGESGLFPEVYTTPVAKVAMKSPMSGLNSPYHSDKHDSGFSMDGERSAAVKPVSMGMPSGNAFAKRNQSNGTRSASMGNLSHQTNNAVMNETLSVIEEHITDMHTPRQSFLNGTTYHSPDDDYMETPANRLSYINGDETDEEDVGHLTESEVRGWSPIQVAEHLESLGAERSHCEVFQDQEITGDVLLDMDRETVLLKEFDLGTLGRRLALFQKIQRFQAEIKNEKPVSRKPSQSHRSASMTSYSEATRDRAVSTGTVLPKIPGLNESSQTQYLQFNSNNRQRSQSTGRHEITSTLSVEPTRAGHAATLSSNSARSVPHNRRHSSIDYSAPNTPEQTHMPVPSSPSHTKQRSFDKTWTMTSDSRTLVVPDSQPSSASGHRLSPSLDTSHLSPQSPDYRSNMANAVDLDRGYFSSNETDSRRVRNFLRKRDSGSHTRAPSDGHGSLRLSGVFKHIRTGSSDSVADTTHNESGFLKGVSRAFTSSSKDSPTKSEHDTPSILSVAASSTAHNSSITESSPAPAKQKSTKSRVTGLRAISDAITGNERSLASKNALGITGSKDLIVQSPTRTDSSNQSITSTSKSVSFDEKKESPSGLPAAKYVSFPTNAQNLRRKQKHETSAYKSGLEKKTPEVQIAGSDYSGWMKKKSKKLGKWHPRLFVLRGRRLSYYYSEDDTEEKGLIDISFHRVLPANKDIMTSLSATLRSGSGPVSPLGTSLQTAAQVDAANAPKDGAEASGVFIFKLVPPRPGMSKAVNFTQPKVHFFAVNSLQEGRAWMAALMKATIERDELKPLQTTYKEKTISLNRAKELQVRPKEFTNGNEIGSLEDQPTMDTLETVEENDTKEKEIPLTLSESKEDDRDPVTDLEGWSIINSSTVEPTKEVAVT